MQLKESRGTQLFSVYVPSQGTAGTVDNWPIWQAPFKMSITAVTFIPSASITANGTNFAVYTLTRYTAGASATTVATRTWAATNSTVSVAESFTLSGTAANLILALGDTLEVVKTVGGTGLVIPDGQLLVSFQVGSTS